jgi:competence protein ComEA
MKKFLLFVCCGFSLFALDINKASTEEFQTINGIGKAKADKIVAYRDEIKCFKSIDELKNVKGIGDSILMKNKDNLEIGECPKSK